MPPSFDTSHIAPVGGIGELHQQGAQRRRVARHFRHRLGERVRYRVAPFDARDAHARHAFEGHLQRVAGHRRARHHAGEHADTSRQGRRVGRDVADRGDRHDDLVAEIREAGARIRLIPDGDVAGAITTAWPDSGADIMFGIGGTPEGVIAAAALKGMGGELQGRLWPRDDAERNAAIAAGYDLSKVLSTDDLVAGDNCFFAATGITDGELLKGVHVSAGFVSTQSLVIRSKTGTVRLMNARHRQN